MQDERIYKIIEYAKVLFNEIGIDACFPQERISKIKKLNTESADNEFQLSTQVDTFKKDIF